MLLWTVNFTSNLTVNIKLYVGQMNRLKEVIQIKRPVRRDDVINQHDSPRPP